METTFKRPHDTNPIYLFSFVAKFAVLIGSLILFNQTFDPEDFSTWLLLVTTLCGIFYIAFVVHFFDTWLPPKLNPIVGSLLGITKDEERHASGNLEGEVERLLLSSDTNST